MKKINEYFFGVEEIHLSDGIWFYGGIITMILLMIITLWP